MLIFKSKSFAKFARNEGISDAKLCQVVRDADAGKIDAEYGGGVIKQRIARPGEGKSGGIVPSFFTARATRPSLFMDFPKANGRA